MSRQEIVSPESIDEAMIAACGMDCGLCRARLRERNRCEGCNGDDASKSKSCAACRIRNCDRIDARAGEFCYQCDAFPCARLRQLDKRYRTKYGMSMLENLESIRKTGLERFVASERTRWECVECGGVVCVHSKECLYCGHVRDQASGPSVNTPRETRRMKSISPCLWFDGRAEEAADFYVSVFEDSRILSTTRNPEGMPGPAGSVLTVRFVLDGEEFTALNGGPQYQFTPAVSFVASCDTQEKIDRLWGRLTEGGVEVQCGWLVDRFGVSWQVVPEALDGMLNSTDGAAAQRAATAMLQMVKLDIAALRRAFDGA